MRSKFDVSTRKTNHKAHGTLISGAMIRIFIEGMAKGSVEVETSSDIACKIRLLVAVVLSSIAIIPAWLSMENTLTS